MPLPDAAATLPSSRQPRSPPMRPQLLKPRTGRPAGRRRRPIGRWEKQDREAPPGGQTRHCRAFFGQEMARAGLAGTRRLRAGGVAFLILLATLSVSPSSGNKRNGPIRLRENLWATGHFMGKKSPLSWTHPQSPFSERRDPNSIPETFSPADLLTRELLQILLQQRLQEENQDLKEQGTPSLMKLLAKYI